MELFIVLVVVAACVYALATEKLPVDLTAIFVAIVLVVTRVLTPEQGLSGLGNPATVTVAAMFVLSAGLARTGALNSATTILAKLGRRLPWVAILLLMLVAGAASAFVNNTAVVAIFLPIVLTLSIHYYAFAYLLVSSALASVGGDLEEMGEIAGASRGQILKRITFPLVLPAILSSFILTFSRAIGTFGVPAFLGLKTNYYTISTMLYSSVRSRRTVQAYILSIVLIAIAVFTVWMNQKMIGKRKSFTTIGGKGTRRNLVSLGKWKTPILVIISAFLIVAVIFPVFILLFQTFMLKDGIYSLSNLTLHYWVGASNPKIFEGEAGIFRNPAIWTSLANTMKLVLSASLIATFVGLMLGYIISRGRKKLSGRLIEQVSFLPYLIPSIAFGAIYLSMFSKPQLFMPALYGTLALLIVISVVKYLPFSTRSGTSNMMQIGTELEEAAMIEGASFWKRFTRIVMPLAGKGFMSGFILIFVSAMKELDLLVLLMTPSTSTLAAMTYSYAESGFHQFSDALITLIVIIIMAVYLLSAKLGNVDMSKGLGG